jgi:polar amino acid transport system ATP-binding protein
VVRRDPVLSDAANRPSPSDSGRAVAPEPPIVELVDVRKSFGDQAVLDGVDLRIERGETVAIIGPSGAGKTTLLRCVNFLETYDSGRILVNGQLVGYREDGERLVPDHARNVNRMRSRIGFVFQRFNLFPHRTALQNLLEGPVHVLRVDRQAARERALAALGRVGLPHKADSYPHELSGGEQQRVGIARALCMEPEVMLFDEVTSALDPELVGEVLAVMRTLSQDGMTMLTVTHELGFARRCADRVVFMEQGRVAADLPAQQFFDHPPTPRIEAYLNHFRGEQDVAS